METQAFRYIHMYYIYNAYNTNIYDVTSHHVFFTCSPLNEKHLQDFDIFEVHRGAEKINDNA